MAHIQEKLKTNLAASRVDGDTLKVDASVYFVAKTESARRKDRDFHADRAHIARAGELGFLGRMWHGLAETYYQKTTRRLLREYHDNGTNVTLGRPSAAFDEAKAQIAQLKANEDAEAEALAISTNLSPENYVNRDYLHFLDSETADTVGVEIANRARELVTEFTLGNISEDQLDIGVVEVANRLRDQFPDLFSKSAIGSDLGHVARQARETYLAHGLRVKNVDLDLDFYLGGAGGAFHTEEKRDIADKIIDWAQGGTIRAKIFNPLTLGVATATGALVTKALSRKEAPIAGSIVGGAFAALRRWSKENKDRHLKLREDEVGYDLAGPRAQGSKIEKVLGAIVGQTDFRNYTYDPRSALESRETLDTLSVADAITKQSVAWQDQAISQIADIRVRIGISEQRELALVKLGQKREEDGSITVSGTATLNRDKMKLQDDANFLQNELVAILGQSEFTRRYGQQVNGRIIELSQHISEKDRKFLLTKLFQSARSGLFAGIVGYGGAKGIEYAGEFVEKGIEEIVDEVGGVVNEIRAKEVPLGDGPYRTVITATRGGDGLKVELSDTYTQHVDVNRNLLLIDGPEGHFEVPIGNQLSKEQLEAVFASAGLHAKVSEPIIDTITTPAHTIQNEILKPEWQAAHGLTEITGRNSNITFGHAQFLAPGQHEYNELTLYQNTGTDWSIGPKGLDGSAVLPIVYKQYGSWADSALIANAPVSREDLVGFVQVRDEVGKMHTLLLDQKNGHFVLPSELVNPTTGKVDAVGFIGYGMAKDASGKMISDQILKNPDLINGGTFHSMASIPLSQAARMVPGDSFNIETFTVEDLTHIVKTPGDGGHFDFPDIPPVPTPFAPRIFPELAKGANEPIVPIVPPGETPIYVPGYYGRTSDEMKQEFKKKFSPALLNNREVVLDPAFESAQYMNNWSPEWKKEVENKARFMKKMDPNTKIVVAIPVASHQEGENIYNTLEQYANQKDADGNELAPKEFEIMLYLNRPKNSKADRTEKEVARFRKNYPSIRLSTINKVFKEREPIGRLRKLMADLIVYRANKAGIGDNDVVIVSNDADAVKINQKYLSSILKAFEKNSHADAVMGKLEWYDEILKKYPVFYASNRFIQYLDIAIRHAPEGEKHVTSSGANFAFKSSIYSAVGGYDSVYMGEDVLMGAKIKVARAGNSNAISNDRFPIFYANRAKVVTNPRRGLAKYLEGTPVVSQWDDFAESDYVRRFGLAEQIKGDETDGFDKERLEREINISIHAYRLTVDSPVVKRALDFLKVDYHVDGDEIRLDSIERLEESFRRFARDEISSKEIFPETAVDSGEESLGGDSSTKGSAPTTTDDGIAGTEDEESVEKEVIVPRPVRGSQRGVLADINRKLASSEKASETHEISDVELKNYVLSMPMGVGKLKDLNIQIVGDKANLVGEIGVPFGNVKLNVDLVNDPSGGISAVVNNLDLSGTASGRRQQVEQGLTKLNDLIAQRFNVDLDPDWSLRNLKIGNGKVIAAIATKSGQPIPSKTLTIMQKDEAASTKEEEGKVLEQLEDKKKRAASEVIKRIDEAKTGEKKSMYSWMQEIAKELKERDELRTGKKVVLDYPAYQIQGKPKARVPFINPRMKMTKEEAQDYLESRNLVPAIAEPELVTSVVNGLAKVKLPSIRVPEVRVPSLRLPQFDLALSAISGFPVPKFPRREESPIAAATEVSKKRLDALAERAEGLPSSARNSFGGMVAKAKVAMDQIRDTSERRIKETEEDDYVGMDPRLADAIRRRQEAQRLLMRSRGR